MSTNSIAIEATPITPITARIPVPGLSKPKNWNALLKYPPVMFIVLTTADITSSPTHSAKITDTILPIARPTFMLLFIFTLTTLSPHYFLPKRIFNIFKRDNSQTKDTIDTAVNIKAKGKS